MQILEVLSDPGWIGILIAAIGLVVAFLLYKASRIGAQLAFQVRSWKLIEKGEKTLPEDVEILFRGSSISRLMKTHVIFWNSGKAMVSEKSIILDDPLRVVFINGAEVLRVRILTITRKTNKFTTTINPSSPNEVICGFDYLDPGDGVVMEVLHTGKQYYPDIRGTLRGIPKGPMDYGSIPELVNIGLFPPKYTRKILYAGLIMMLIIGGYFLFPTFLSESLKLEDSPLFNDNTNIWFFMILILFNIVCGSFLLWKTRRQYPSLLVIEDNK
ncbi:MAG: hypothetical protein Q8P44_11035 [Dehalococcoidia bacterium]|nr:hypothetical protein [Dehalococcoidia bacterium]